MAVLRGTTRPGDLSVSLKVTFRPKNAVQRPEPIGRDGRALVGAARVASERSLDLGRREAAETLYNITSNAAQQLEQFYEAQGYTIPVYVKKLGAGFKLEVDPDPWAQKWARILESGYGSQNMRAFVEGAKKKRAVKIRRRGESGGYYLIIPKVHGRVTQSGAGQLQFQPARDDRLVKDFGTDEELRQLGQFEAKPTGVVTRRTFNATGPAEMERAYPKEQYGDRNPVSFTGEYDPRQGKIVWEKDRHGKNAPRLDKQGARLTQKGPQSWEAVTVEQRRSKSGRLYRKDGKEMYDRAMITGEYNPALANRKGARIIDKLNRRGEQSVERTGVNNLRFNALNGSLPEHAPTPAKRQVVERRGEVLSFITLSSRKPMRDRPGRTGTHAIAKAKDAIRRDIQAAIRATEQADMPPSRKQGQLEVLRSALGIS